MKKLPRSFYTRPTLVVARDLLGKFFIRKLRSKYLVGMIVETEAYRYDDPASHSYRGPTKRNSVMFGNGGLLYVYFTYGMHYCANVVTNTKGYGEAVLIRAVEPIEEIDVMMKFRKSADQTMKNLTNGPAKFAQAFNVTVRDSGTDLTKETIFIGRGIDVPRSQIVAATRIGISAAQEKKWRFYLRENAWVSKK
jgi:DNA-3-methyladenine glycosylase